MVGHDLLWLHRFQIHFVKEMFKTIRRCTRFEWVKIAPSCLKDALRLQIVLDAEATNNIVVQKLPRTACSVFLGLKLGQMHLPLSDAILRTRFPAELRDVDKLTTWAWRNTKKAVQKKPWPTNIDACKLPVFPKDFSHEHVALFLRDNTTHKQLLQSCGKALAIDWVEHGKTIHAELSLQTERLVEMRRRFPVDMFEGAVGFSAWWEGDVLKCEGVVWERPVDLAHEMALLDVGPRRKTKVNTQRKIRVNDPCLCGSGKKYKKCCRK
jgi:hypothetical protein